MNLIARQYEKMDKNPTGELRDKIEILLVPYLATHHRELIDLISYQLLEACKESGLKFVTSFVGTDYKDGIPTVAREIKEIVI